MADAQYDMLDAASLQKPQLMRQERFASDQDERLRYGFGKRREACCQATGKYGDGEHEI
jgi:hypothetical protein